MAKMNLKKIYESMCESDDRTEALDNAEAIAKLTLPSLAPKGQKIEERPTTSVGTQAVRSLSSSLTKAMFPPGSRAFRLDLPPAAWEWITAQKGAEGVKMTRERLDMREKAIVDALNLKTSRSRFASSNRRLIVEGTLGAINRPDRIDLYPLRSLVVEREAGKPRIMAFLDEVTPDPVADNDEQETKADETVCTYTLANFETGEVWKQEGKKAARQIDPSVKQKNRKGDDENPPETLDIRQFICGSGEIPDVGDYPNGYAYNYQRLFSMLDNIDASLNEAMSIASWNLLRLKPGSAVARDPVSLKKKRSGDPVIADKDDIEWLAIQAKLADFAFIANLRPLLVDEAAKAFLMGISDRIMSADTSATAVLEIRDELNQQTMDLLTSIEQTILQPLIESEMYLQEQISPLFADLPPEVTEQIVKVVVITGANAIEKERQERALILQMLPQLMLMDQRLSINGLVAYNALTASRSIGSLEGLVTRMDDEQYAMLLQAQAGAAGGDKAKPVQGKRTETIQTRGGPQIPQSNLQPPKPGA